MGFYVRWVSLSGFSSERFEMGLRMAIQTDMSDSTFRWRWTLTESLPMPVEFLETR